MSKKSKKLVKIFSDSTKLKNKKSKPNLNPDKIDVKEIIRLCLFFYSIYYYFSPVKLILINFIQNKDIIQAILSMHKLFFTINSTWKFVFYLIIYTFF